MKAYLIQFSNVIILLIVLKVVSFAIYFPGIFQNTTLGRLQIFICSKKTIWGDHNVVM